jgi:adenylate cyclase
MLKLSALITKRLPSILCCLGLAFLFLFALSWGGFFPYFDTALYDFLLGQKIKSSPRALNPQIIPIDLNDKTEKILGGRLNDRSAFADLFSVISYSRAQVALDFIYRGEREQDKYLLEAAAALKALFIAVIPVPEGRDAYLELTPDEKELLRSHLWRPKEFGAGNIPRAGTFVMPFLELGRQASQLTHIGIDPDTDGIFRRTPLFYAWEDGLIPAISIAAALQELGVDGNDIEIHYGKELRIPIDTDLFISIPIDSSGIAVVPFGGKWEDTTHRFSMDKLADAWHDKTNLDEIRNDLHRNLCFVADTTFEKKDLGPIPFEKVYLLSGLHTWVISAILDAAMGEDTFFREVPRHYRTACIVLIAALFLILGIIRRDWIYNVGAGALFLVFIGASLYLWFFRRIMPWMAFGALEILFIWLFGFIYRFLTQRQKQSALERYVPRPVAQKLVSGQKISLEPVFKELTIIFTDIKSFTTWSSDKEAKDVHSFLNDYLESMADILFAHNATVDKFMGDGILAFFGEPLELPNHAEVAVKAALEMQRKIKELGEKWKPKVDIDLKVRMGINTGKVIVGDLGTRRRIEYTVIGSAVNLAQRMEGLATPGGILVTEYTKAAVEAAYAKGACPVKFSESLELTVKGYYRPITGYEIVFSNEQ